VDRFIQIIPQYARIHSMNSGKAPKETGFFGMK
jgi:hypothetical protein